MGFIDAYKRLDKLCGEALGSERGVSTYIDAMLGLSYGASIIEGWDEDLKQLKHYRWVRNQIAHEPGCTEENMCDEGDELWAKQFYLRVMHQTDPLAMYRKQMQRLMEAKRQKTTSKVASTKKPTPKRKKNVLNALVVALAFIILVAVLVLLGLAAWLML